MTTLRHGLLAMMLLFFSAVSGAQNFVAVPPLQAPVTDLAGMLTPAQKQTLDNVLREYETRTGSQIAILLLSKTEPEPIEQYGIRVAEAWKIGRKGIDDGAILIVAKDNPPALRRLRIEAGRGVQGTLTDAQSKRILQDVIAPHFRQNDYYGGLAAGVNAITGLLDKEHFPAPDNRPGTEVADESFLGGWLPFIIFFLIFMMMSRGRRRRHFGRGWDVGPGIILGSGMGGGMFGGSGGGGFGGGFSGGGGTFDGGGASGNW